MKTSLKTWLALAAAVSLAVTGCVSAGTMAHVRGEVDASLDSSYSRTRNAVDLAIKQLEFVRVSEKHDALTATFVVRTADDKNVSIKVSKVTDRTTQVAIWVGLLGDQKLSMTILERIKTDL